MLKRKQGDDDRDGGPVQKKKRGVAKLIALHSFPSETIPFLQVPCPLSMFIDPQRSPSVRYSLSEGSWLDLMFLSPDAVLRGPLLASSLYPKVRATTRMKGILTPRDQVMCVQNLQAGDGGPVTYRFGGKTHRPTASVPEAILPLWAALDDAYGTFHFGVINRYIDGTDSISPHADDEKEIKRDSPIASISLGATRTFVVHANDGSHRMKIPLADGTVLVMGGAFQSTYKHSVPKEKAVADGRVNVTLRQFLPQ